MRILSDCNSVFISHMLIGAKVNTRVQEVITNLSSFVRCQPHSDPQSASQADSAHSDAESSTASPDKVQSASSGSESAGGATWGAGSVDAAAGKAAASHRMVIQPRHDWTVSSHGCPLCPANLCKVWTYLPTSIASFLYVLPYALNMGAIQCLMLVHVAGSQD